MVTSFGEEKSQPMDNFLLNSLDILSTFTNMSDASRLVFVTSGVVENSWQYRMNSSADIKFPHTVYSVSQPGAMRSSSQSKMDPVGPKDIWMQKISNLCKHF